MERSRDDVEVKRRSIIAMLMPGTIVLAILTGCAAAPGHPLNLVATGPVFLVPRADGQGTKDLGAFVAGGTTTISASCVGSGTATVSLPPSGQQLTTFCTSPNVPGGQSSSVTLPLDAETKFHILVIATKTTKWSVSVGASHH